MTHVYEWFSFPNRFSVRCPTCDKEATCILNSATPWNIGIEDSTWLDRDTGRFRIYVSCTECGLHGLQTLAWPEDAYWRFEVKGSVLWAWSLQHAGAILEYLESKDRKRYPKGYLAAMLHLPEHFKLAKNRAAVTKAIRKRLTAG